ncbi:MAG TPA: universal stress protein [Anaerolineales bacterium]|nr:universal stress protein [Anaerolineales bacterium]
MKSEFLIVTNGFKGTWAAIEYGAALARAMRMKTTLLGVTEELNPAAIDDHHPLEDIFAQAVELFQKLGVEYSLDIRNGIAEKIIPQIANHREFITVVSPLGRPQFKRWLTGRSIRLLMEQIHNPILYVPQARLPVQKLLVTVGGLGYGEAAENIAVQIARANNADVTILYVVPPTDLDYPSTRNLQAHINDLAETDTLPGRSLKKALEIAQGAGLNAKAKARQGIIVEEILAEINEGAYDLVCMGSAYSANTLRQYYAPNVTAEVADSAPCPVLTARFTRRA